MTAAAPRIKGLNATQLKYFATAMMLLDHINMLLRPFAGLQTAYPLASQTLYFLGRMAFPVFAFFVAEGMRYTRNRKAYLLRLGIFGLATELPFLLGLLTGSGSVIATFFLAAAGGFTYDRLKQKLPGWISILPLLLFALLAHLAPTDYGWVGVLTVACVYLAPGRKLQLVVLALFMGLEYLFLGNTFPNAAQWVAAGMAWLAVLLLALLYNNQRGRGSKWFFYWFYPLHLIVLGGLAIIL